MDICYAQLGKLEWELWKPSHRITPSEISPAGLPTQLLNPALNR